MGLALCAAAVSVAAGSTSDARADEVYWTPKALLKDFFPRSEKVTYLSLEIAGHRGLIEKQLGYTPPKPKYVIFVAKTGEHIDGYAVIDEELGQHEPITFGVKLSATGTVERTEVMAYRERYGSEIREARFRQQFTGKSSTDAIRAGDDVVVISGATISSKSITIGVRRAVALVSVLLRDSQPTLTAARFASSGPS
ncbi:MAG: FMN-binding protein [Deltaproteobacteria bacterium]|nr:FMN-binding protein [Deltaproteobacteria bacterium]